VSPCKLSVALNVAAFAALSAALVAEPPGGLALAAAGLIVWALAKTQLKKC
jgi:hypothetical protein